MTKKFESILALLLTANIALHTNCKITEPHNQNSYFDLQKIEPYKITRKERKLYKPYLEEIGSTYLLSTRSTYLSTIEETMVELLSPNLFERGVELFQLSPNWATRIKLPKTTILPSCLKQNIEHLGSNIEHLGSNIVKQSIENKALDNWHIENIPIISMLYADEYMCPIFIPTTVNKNRWKEPNLLTFGQINRPKKSLAKVASVYLPNAIPSTFLSVNKEKEKTPQSENFTWEYTNIPNLPNISDYNILISKKFHLDHKEKSVRSKYKTPFSKISCKYNAKVIADSLPNNQTLSRKSKKEFYKLTYSVDTNKKYQLPKYKQKVDINHRHKKELLPKEIDYSLKTTKTVGSCLPLIQTNTYRIEKKAYVSPLPNEENTNVTIGDQSIDQEIPSTSTTIPTYNKFVPNVNSIPLFSYITKESCRQYEHILDQFSKLPSTNDLKIQNLSQFFKVNTKIIEEEDGYIFEIEMRPKEDYDNPPIKHHIYYIVESDNPLTRSAIISSIKKLSPNSTFNIEILNTDPLAIKNLRCTKPSIKKACNYLEKEKSTDATLFDLVNRINKIKGKALTVPGLHVILVISETALLTDITDQRDLLKKVLQEIPPNLTINTATCSKNANSLKWLSRICRGKNLYEEKGGLFKQKLPRFVTYLTSALAYNVKVTTLSDNMKVYNQKLAPILYKQGITLYGESDSLDEINFILQGNYGNNYINIVKSTNLESPINGDIKVEKMVALTRAISHTIDYVNYARQSDLDMANSIMYSFTEEIPQ